MKNMIAQYILYIATLFKKRVKSVFLIQISPAGSSYIACVLVIPIKLNVSHSKREIL